MVVKVTQAARMIVVIQSLEHTRFPRDAEIRLIIVVMFSQGDKHLPLYMKDDEY